jgi:PadR family transcriptional regulator PadR
VRSTNRVRTVASALMADPTGQHWGYDLRKKTGLRSGVLYPILHRMLDAGWLSDGWEAPAASRRGKPPRRYYTLTTEGRREVGALLARAGIQLASGMVAVG